MLSRIRIALCSLFFMAAAVAADNSELKDLFYGEAIYYAHQGQYFDAIARLDAELGQHYAIDEPELGSLHYHLNYAEFSVGDFELFYRMHQRAGRALKAVMEGNVDEETRNDAAYRLARILLQKNQPINALHALEKIKGSLPERIRVAEKFLRAQVYIANGRFTDAIELLQQILKEESMQGFAGYNLGIAMIQDGREKEGLMQLDKVGQISSDDKSVLAIKDKSNLALGYRLLESNYPALAKTYFERVRLSGPFSNRALLGSGWVDVALGKFERALVPWTILHKREKTNAEVQEALMAVPYAFGKLNVYGKAALLYGSAMEIFSRELETLDASIKSIREGKFLEALEREEFEHDKNWLIRLRELPDAPETHYIMDLMASHDFQESLKNYHDLEALRIRLEQWLENISSYEEIIEMRRRYYEPLLPVVEKKFNSLDSRLKLRMEQRARLDQRLKKMLVAPRPEYLAKVNERLFREAFDRIEQRIAKGSYRISKANHARLERLKGVIFFPIYTQYDERLTEAYEHLRDLNEIVDRLERIYQSFIRTRQSATQSYTGYEIPLRKLTISIQVAQEKLIGIKARQGRILELMAVNELDRRRKRLEEYQIKTRFALAESYDRATAQENERQAKEIQEQLKESKEETKDSEEEVKQPQEEIKNEGPQEQVKEQKEQTKASPQPVKIPEVKSGE